MGKEAANDVPVRGEQLCDGVTLYEGDALDVLRELPDEEFDAVITDPPYANTNDASSQMCRSRRAVREVQFFEAWLREHLREIVRVLKPTGVIWLTIDWRGALTLDVACGKLNIAEPKIGVWDKEQIGMGHILRNSYECFAVVPMPEFERKTASERDVWRHSWGSASQKFGDHSAEKPLDLFRRAVRLVTDPGGSILDPFAGTGVTAVAARREDRECVLIESDPDHCATIRRRVLHATGTGPGSLFQGVQT